MKWISLISNLEFYKKQYAANLCSEGKKDKTNFYLWLNSKYAHKSFGIRSTVAFGRGLTERPDLKERGSC